MGLFVSLVVLSVCTDKACAGITTVRVCSGVQTLTSTSEIFLTASVSSASASVTGINIYNSAGTLLKTYTSTFPGNVTAAQPLYGTQSFTLASVFGTTNVGPVTVVISYSLGGSTIPANYPTAQFTQTFFDSSGNILAKYGNYCVVQAAG